MTLDTPIGTIRRDPFTQYAQYTDRYAQREPEDAACKTCPWHRVCGTGCPVLNEWVHGNGHPNKRSPFCAAYRSVIPLYIDTYGWALDRLAHGAIAAGGDERI